MKLKSGRTVRFRPMLNGATDAYMTPGQEAMTPEEWAEFHARFDESKGERNAARRASDSQLATHA